MTALITGASGGIGAELARLFARDKYNLVLVARSEEKLAALKAELEAAYGVRVLAFAQDLSESGSAAHVADFIKTESLTIDVLVNNAGFGDWGFFAESSLEKQREMMQLNVVTLTELVHLFLPDMLARKSGRVLNVASVASFMPGPKMSVYYASKAFVRSFSEALAVEVRGTGVTVTALCPGPVSTDFWNRAEAGSSSLFKHLVFADAKSVARCGYRAMQRGRVLAIPGAATKFFVLLSKLLPRTWVRTLVYLIQR